MQIVGCTPQPDEAFICEVGRTMTATMRERWPAARCSSATGTRKWSAPLRHLLEESTVRVVQTPFQAPNCAGRHILPVEVVPNKPGTCVARTVFRMVPLASFLLNTYNQIPPLP